MALPLTLILRKFERWLWLLFFLCAVVFMLTWSLAQVLLWGYNNYSQDIEFWIETKSGYDVSFSSSHNQMSGLNPLLSFSNLKVINKETQVPIADIKKVLIELNTFESLWHLRPVFDEFVIDSLELTVRQKEDLSWSLDGLYQNSTDVSTEDSLEVNRWIDLLFYQGNLDLRDTIVHLHQANQPFDRAMKLDLLVSKDGDYTKMEGEVQGTRNPIDLSFRGVAFQLPGEPDFNFDLYLDIDDLDSKDWAESIQMSDVYQLDQLSASLNVWLNWNYKGVNFVAESAVSNLSINKQDDQRTLDIASDRLLINGKFNDDYCSVAFYESEVTVNDSLYNTPAHRLLCDYLGNWWWTTPELVLEELTGGISWLPQSFEKLKGDLAVLAPQGVMKYPVLWLNSEGEFRLESDLQKVSANAWEGAPGLTNIDGKLVVEQGRGYLDFEAKETKLTFKDLFARSQMFDSVQGRVDWWFEGDDLRVDSRGLALNSTELDAVLGFSFEWEFDVDEARLGLDVSISQGRPGQVFEYLPTNLNKELIEWLNTAFPSSDVIDGRLLYTLTMDPASAVTDTLQISSDVFGEAFSYNPDWPSIDDYRGTFELNNEDLTATLSGFTLGNPVDQVQVKYPNIWAEDSSVISVSLTSQSKLKRYQRFIDQSPLKETLGETLSDWTMSGELALLGDFSLDLDSDELVHVDFQVFPQLATIQIPNLPKVSNVKGEIHYSDTQDLVVRHLEGDALDGRIDLDIKTEQDKYHIKGRGQADINSVLLWQALPEPLTEYLSGNVDYYFDAVVSGTSDLTVSVHSDLTGVASSLPYPLTKEDPQESLIFVYQGEVSSKRELHEIDVGALNIDLLSEAEKGIDRTVVSFGRLPRKSRIPDKGTLVFGRMANIDLKPWLSLASALPSKESEEKEAFYADIAIQEASLGDMTLNNLSLSCSSSDKSHRIAIRSKQASGVIRVPRDDGAIMVDLDYLTLPKPDDEEPPSVDEESIAVKPDQVDSIDPLLELNPASIPEMSLKISQLQLGDRKAGFWKADLLPIKQGVKISVHDSSAFSIVPSGEIVWTKINGVHATYVDGRIETNNLRDVPVSLGYEPSVESKSAYLNFYLYWDGSPAAFDRATAQGLIDMSIEDGQFLNVSNSANTLKVFGLFNLSSITRRLKLDFSDVYASGLAFDQVSGQLSINNGIVTIEDSIEMEGPSADISLNGQTNMIDETLDMDMRLSVPVSGTLPLAVVVAGVNPVIGGLMLLGQGVWGGVVDQFTGVDYRLAGSWEEPKLEATNKVESTDKVDDLSDEKDNAPAVN